MSSSADDVQMPSTASKPISSINFGSDGKVVDDEPSVSVAPTISLAIVKIVAPSGVSAPNKNKIVKTDLLHINGTKSIPVPKPKPAKGKGRKNRKRPKKSKTGKVNKDNTGAAPKAANNKQVAATAKPVTDWMDVPFHVSQETLDEMWGDYFPFRILRDWKLVSPQLVVHPHLKLEKVIARKAMECRMKSSWKIDAKTVILSVGSSPNEDFFSVYGKNIHGCEFGKDAYTQHKLAKFERKKGRTALETGRRLKTHGGFTWCRCKAQNCTHPRDIHYVMWIHSMYQNSPKDIMDTLLKSTSGEGYSMHHMFDPKQSSFAHGEAQYSIDSGLVTMRTQGDNHTYRHPDNRWLSDLEEQGVNGVDAQGKLLWLTWSSVKVSPNTYVTRFILLKGLHGPLPLAIIPTVAVTSKELFYLKAAIAVKNPDTGLAPCTSIVAKGSDTFALTYQDGSVWTIPKFMYTDLCNFALTLTPNAATRKAMRLHLRAQNLKGKYGEVIDLLVVGEVLVLAVFRQIVDALEFTKKTYDHQFYRQIERAKDISNFDYKYNWLSPLKDWWGDKTRWEMVFLIISAMSIGLVLSFCVFMAFTVFTSLSGFVAYQTHNEGASWLYRMASIAVSLILLPFSFGIIPTIIIVTILVALFRKRKLRAKFTRWFDLQEFHKTTGKLMPMGYGDSFKYLPSDGLYDIEGTASIDLDEVEFGDDIKWKIKNVPRLKERQSSTALTGVVFNTSVPTAFAKTFSNMKRTAMHRQCIKVELAEPGFWKKVCNKVGYLLPIKYNRAADKFDLPSDCKVVEQKTWTSWLQHWPSKKRKLAELIKAEIILGADLTKDWAWRFTSKCFQKLEKNNKTTTKKLPDGVRARAISGISDYACILFGKWFGYYSDAMKSVWHSTNNIYYASGRTTDEINDWFNYNMKKYANPIFVCSDFSKFDRHQGSECIREELEAYKNLGFIESHKKRSNHMNYVTAHIAREYLKSKIESRLDWSVVTQGGKRKVGISIKADGLRKSGDHDTSTGNSRITAFSLAYCFKDVGLLDTEYNLAILGDDSISIIDGDALATCLRAMAKRRDIPVTDNMTYETVFEHSSSCCDALKHCIGVNMKRMGLAAKVLVTTNIRQVEFLSSYFYETAGGFRMGKKPGRSLLKIGTMLSKFGRTREEYLQCFKGSLMSYAQTATHVPFLRRYIAVMLAHLSDVEAKFEHIEKWKPLQGGTIYECDELTWGSFTTQFGLTPDHEDQFTKQLIADIEKHGTISIIMHSRFVETLVKIESQSIL